MTQKTNISLQPARVDNVPANEPDWLRPLVEKIVREVGGNAPVTTPFCDFPTLVRHLPMYGARTLRELVKRKIIPAVRPPGSRKLAFHMPSVDLALLRYQQGGPDNLISSDVK